jgi:hypothetical protein
MCPSVWQQQDYPSKPDLLAAEVPMSSKPDCESLRHNGVVFQTGAGHGDPQFPFFQNGAANLLLYSGVYSNRVQFVQPIPPASI